jgi:hypothetical protein
MFLRDRPSAETSDDSCTLLARVLDDSDPRGLWIELDTEKDLPDASAERPALMIPWHEVLSILVAKNLPNNFKVSKLQTLKLRNPATPATLKPCNLASASTNTR